MAAAPPPIPQMSPPEGAGGAFHPTKAPQTAVDFWDLNGDTNLEPLDQDYEFSELVNIRPEERRTSLVTWVIGLVLLSAVGGALYFVYQSEDDPFGSLMALIMSPPPPAASVPIEPAVVEEVPLVQDVSEQVAGKVLEGNPYWYLPNRIDPEPAPLERSWTSEEEEVWRAAMSSPYVYQHFKTVKEIRESRFAGSQALLWDALGDAKLWTRMTALMGLAEFNVPVSLQVVEESLAGARPSLLANFTKRFTKKSSEGERYILRQSLRLVDERARLGILKALRASRDDFTALYMVAGTLDPHLPIQEYARQQLLSMGMGDDEYTRLFEAIASGDFGYLEGSSIGRTSISDLSLERTAVDTSEANIVDDTMDEIAGDSFDEYGVEIFEEVTPSEAVDEEVLEYQVDENF